MIKITPLDSRFLQSCERFSQAPKIIGTEIAILGRSNVGKSSLINILLNHKNLAKSSATPGKTKLINFFISQWRVESYADICKHNNNDIANIMQDSTNDFKSINYDSNAKKDTSQTFTIRMLDFPGFGYAKISKSEKKSWDKHLSDFLQKRDSIKLYLHLLDSRHENLAIDNEIRLFLEGFKRGDSTILEVYTKTDKLSKNKLALLKKQGKILTSTMDKKSIESLRCEILKIMYNVDFLAF